MSVTVQELSPRVAQARSIAERGRRMITVLNLHFAGVALLGLVNLYLLLHMVYAYQQVRSQGPDAVEGQTVQMRAAEQASVPLQGLDTKLAEANREADTFYARRLPSAESQVLSELGSLTAREHVKLSRVQYAQAAVLGNQAGELTEVKMDANLSGDYRALVLLMNSLERDRMFFLISNIALTGQQSGTVNLRLRLTTYLRARAAGDPLIPFAGATGSTVPAEAVDRLADAGSGQ